MAVSSCDSPQAAAQRTLAKESIEPSGRSLVKYTTEGDARVVSLLLAAGVQTEAVDATGRTPLAITMLAGNQALFRKLLDAGAAPNARVGGKTPLVGLAATLPDESYVLALLAKGGNWDSTLPSGEKVLPWAIREGRLKLVEALFHAGADPHLADASGKSVLQQAMESGHKDLVLSLLRLGADPGTRAPDGDSILHHALRNGWDDMVAPLTRAGADPNARSREGNTLLEDAVARADIPRIRLLLANGADPALAHEAGLPSPLDRAVAAPSTDLLSAFLAARAAPRAGWGKTISRLVARPDLPKLRMFFSHGIFPTARDSRGFMPVERAVVSRNPSLVKLLLDHGLPHGRALYLACAGGDHSTAGLLLAYGIPLDSTAFPSLDTPLFAALRGGHDRCAALLIRHGASTHLRNPEGQPAFHIALATGCPLTMGILLAGGADPNQPFTSPVSPAFLRLVRPGIMRWSIAKDRGTTPVMMAADSGNLPVAAMLLKAGAKTQSYTRIGHMWPINFASRRDDVPMMRLFLGQQPYTRERLIIINLGEQRARVFDSAGAEIFTTRVSTGRPGFATRTGEFVITNKHRDWTSTIYHASMPYFQRLSCSDFGMHQGVVPGYPASHGCIRVPAGNASKLFALTQTGDRVRIVKSGWPGIPSPPVQSADANIR